MKANIYNLKGEIIGHLELNEEIFNRAWNPDLVHQALIAQINNRRQPLAHTKGRGEVRGGGKKPWRQKGTGRARHGSIRSPLWIGGGVTHGPLKTKNYRQKINKKMLRNAIYSVLSKRLALNELKIVDNLKLNSPKTKELILNLKGILKDPINTLIIPTVDNKLIFRASSNIPKVKCLHANSFNIEDLLKYKNILIDKEAVVKIR
jgi:large subunit ribosomal protein L4